MTSISQPQLRLSQFIENAYPKDQPEEETTSAPFNYKADTDDFGVAIKSLLIPHEDKDFLYTQKNLEDIGEQEGFVTYKTGFFYPIRDSRIRTPSAVLRSTETSKEIIEIALDKLANRDIHLRNQSASVATEQSSLRGFTQGKVSQTTIYHLAVEGYSSEAKANLGYELIEDTPITETSIKKNIKLTRSYWEGGNVFSFTNPRGERVVLIGESSLTITHRILKEEGYFDFPSETQQTIAYERETGQFAGNFSDSVNTLYLNKKIPGVVESLIPSQLSSYQEDQIIDEMNAIDLCNVPYSPSYLAKRYLGELEFVKKVLWPSEFDVEPSNIVIVPQADYHLDCFMKPGPSGSLLLQDFDLTLSLLKEIQLQSEELQLNREEVKILKSYLAETKKLKNDLQPIYDKIHSVCKQADLPILPVAGTFFGFNPQGDKVNINFLNGISGYSPVNQRFYYITAGVSLSKKKSKLASLLMSAFQKTLERLASPIHVYFVGYDPTHQKNNKNYSEMMTMVNKNRIGVHCMTLELETEDTGFPLNDTLNSELTHYK